MNNKPNDDDKDIEQIEANLATIHGSMTAMVNELAARLSPSTLTEDTKGRVKARASRAAEAVKGAVSNAKRGDQCTLAIVGGTTTAAVGVLVLKFAHRRRAKRHI